MCTNESLSSYFINEPFLKDYFIGVYAFDELSQTQTHVNIIKRMVKNGSFFIYNNETIKQNGEHWRLLLKLDANHFFCFDSLGTESCLKQIPLFLRSNIHLFESVEEIQTNIQINTLNINYNEIEISSYIRQTNHFPYEWTADNHEFYWFTKFILKYSSMTGQETILFSYNKTCFQWENSSLFGAFAAYFISLLPNYLINGQIYLPLLCRLLNYHFYEVSSLHASELAQINLLPFFHFVRTKLFKHLDATAKQLFEKDIKLHLYLRKTESLVTRI